MFPNITHPTSDVGETSAVDNTTAVSPNNKGKGKAPAASPTNKGNPAVENTMNEEEEEDDDDDDDDDDEEGDEEDEDEDEEETYDEIDPSAIVATGRRTRGNRVDYTSEEALKKAGLKPGDAEEDEDEIMN